MRGVLTRLGDHFPRSQNRSPLSNVVVELIVEDYFKTCRELADALWQNPAVPLSKTDVMTFMHSDPYLILCDAIAQTVKHDLRQPRTKKDPDPLSAWIDWYATSAGLQIRWENVSQSRSGGRLLCACTPV